MALIPDVVVVAPGELITADHLNDIRANLDRLDTDKATVTQLNTKVAKAGDTMTGKLTNSFEIQAGDDPGTSAVTGIKLLGSTGRLQSQVGAPLAAGQPNIMCNRTGGSGAVDNGAQYVWWQRSAVTIGTVTIASATSVAYNTTSDPRLKRRTADAGDALELVARLGATVFRGRWIDPDTGEPEAGGAEWVMVSSHDVEDVAPFAVTGERDAIDDAGNISPQQVNFGALVPLLAAAVAQLADRVTALEGNSYG
jgi:hypothetical protein